MGEDGWAFDVLKGFGDDAGTDVPDRGAGWLRVLGWNRHFSRGI